MSLLVYRKFHEHDKAIALADLLRQNNIQYEVTGERDNVDKLYGDTPLSQQFHVKIYKDDFPKVDALVARESEKNLAAIGSDHYLFEFTDDELFEILTKPDEWSSLDFQLAKKILRDRGREVNDDTIRLLHNQRISELAKPEKSSRAWIYAGYFFAIMFGFIGLFMGLAIMSSKKTLPDGQRVHTYSPDDRKHGINIFVIGVGMVIVTIIFKIATSEFD